MILQDFSLEFGTLKCSVLSGLHIWTKYFQIFGVWFKFNLFIKCFVLLIILILQGNFVSFQFGTLKRSTFKIDWMFFITYLVVKSKIITYLLETQTSLGVLRGFHLTTRGTGVVL